MCDKTSKKTPLPWSNGYYEATHDGQLCGFAKVNGCSGSFTFGNFDKLEDGHMVFETSIGHFSDPDKRGLQATGQSEYSVKLVYGGPFPSEVFANVEEDGRRWTLMNGTVWKLLDEETVESLKNDTDPVEEMPNDYVVKQNGKKGKIIWITGGIGMGKSTTGLYLKENEGFVFYEGDCFLLGLNPYIGSAPRGGTTFGTRPLRGISVERKAAIKKAFDEGYKQLEKGEKVSLSSVKEVYTLMVEEIERERKRLGGDWIVVQAVYTRETRDYIRSLMGPNLRFVALNMDPELQVKRIVKRMQGKECQSEEAREKMKGWSRGYEPGQDDEENTQILEIKEDMSTQDVANQILKFHYS